MKMTEEEFRKLFGNRDDQLIKISDLHDILVEKPKEILVHDFLWEHHREVWKFNDKTKSMALRALRSAFGKDWYCTLTFPELIKDFSKLSRIKGIGKKTLQNIIKLCELKGEKLCYYL